VGEDLLGGGGAGGGGGGGDLRGGGGGGGGGGWWGGGGGGGGGGKQQVGSVRGQGVQQRGRGRGLQQVCVCVWGCMGVGRGVQGLDAALHTQHYMCTVTNANAMDPSPHKPCCYASSTQNRPHFLTALCPPPPSPLSPCVPPRCLPDAVVLQCIRLASLHSMTLTAYCGDRIFCRVIDEHTNR